MRTWLNTALIALALTTAAGAQEPGVGTYELEGSLNLTEGGERVAKVELVIERLGDVYSATRTMTYTGARDRRRAPAVWLSSDVTVTALEGGSMQVTVVFGTLADADRSDEDRGAIHALEGEETDENDGDAQGSESAAFVSELVLTSATAVETLTNHHGPDEDDWSRGTFRGLLVQGADRLRLGHELVLRGNHTLSLIVPTDGQLRIAASKGTLALLDRFGGEIISGQRLTHEIALTDIGTYTVQVEAEGLTTITPTFVQTGATDSRISAWSGSYWPIDEWNSYESYAEGKEPNTSCLYSEGGPLDRFDKAFGLTVRAYGDPKMSAVFWERGGDEPRAYPKSMMANGHYCRFSSLDESMAELAWHYDFNRDGRETSRFHELQVTEGQIVPMDPAGEVGRKIRKRLNTETVTNEGGGTLLHEDASAWRLYRVTNANSTRQVFYLQHSAELDAVQVFKSAADRDAGIASVATLTSPSAFQVFDVTGVDRLRIKGKLGAMLSDGQRGTVYGGDWTDMYDWDGNGSRQDVLRRGWYGHCNAKSIASSFFRLPSPGTYNGVEFRENDFKGILTEYAMGTVQRTGVTWGKNHGEDRDRADYAKAFHELLHRWIRTEKNSVWGDHTLRKTGQKHGAVWNYVITGYTSTFVEAEGGDPRAFDVVTNTSGGSSNTSSYRLHYDRSGRILAGQHAKTEWTHETWWRYVFHTTDITYAHRNRNRAVTPERLKTLFEAFGGLKFQNLADVEAEAAAEADVEAVAEPLQASAETTPTH